MKRVLTKLTLAVGTVTRALAVPVLGQTAAAPDAVVVTAAPASPLAPDAGATSWDAGPYTYDPSGNIIGIAGGSGQQMFRYDVNGRPATSMVTGPTIAGTHVAAASRGGRFRGTESKRDGDEAFKGVCREFGVNPRSDQGRRLHDLITKKSAGPMDYDDIYGEALSPGWEPQ